MGILTRSYPAARLCRYSDCMNAKDDLSNVCPHHEASDAECRAICGLVHDQKNNDAACRCWITCNACLEFCGIPTLADKDFPSTVTEVA